MFAKCIRLPVVAAMAVLPTMASPAQAAAPAAPAASAPASAQPAQGTPGQGAPGQGAPGQVKAAIPFVQAVALSRWVLIALEQAKETGNYSVLNALGSSDFRAANPPEKLAVTFAGQRQYRTSRILTEMPQFTQEPVIDKGNMVMAGAYVVGPLRERFVLAFRPENNDWRLTQLSVAIDVLQAQPPASPPAKRN